MRTKRPAIVGLIATLALVGAACSKTSTPLSGGSSSTPTPGGVYRTAINSFGFTDGFDPTGEYLSTSWEFYQAMLRTLVTYRHVAGVAGTQLVPDLATSVPTPTNGGLTYTFHLKPGVMFGPPVSRPITSKDIAYAFERIDSTPEAAQYAFYYDGTIVGMHQHAGPPAPISGIQTPNPTTIVFHLTKPTGDFLYRLALDATAPIPQEVAKCFPTAGGYGRDIVSSGPYMIQGANQVNISSCSTIKPMSGFDPSSHLYLVRNPDYKQSTDTARSNYVNGISVTIDSNVSDIFNKVQSGTLDGTLGTQPPLTVLSQYQSSSSLRPLLHSDPNNAIWYLGMNLATPPFNDVHVRQAVNDVIDKAALVKAWGGSVYGQIATSITPPLLLGNQLTQSYDPYATPGFAGDLAKAKAAMMLSKTYDPKHDGMCDVAACKNVLMINRNYAPWSTMEPIVVQDLAQIGIQVVPRELETGASYQTIETVKNDVPLYLNAGWGPDYPDPYTFAQPLFSTSSIVPVGTPNNSLVGLTAAQARADGIPYPAGGVPSVDPQINHCEGLSGSARLSCWVGFNKTVMQSVVPFVPYLWSNEITVVAPSVTRYAFDQFTGIVSLTQLAVNNNATL
ncbi:MAG TPA: ABC transporter substrate-binding protein [Actinomycetota bacterium]